ncbi:MAG: hypothetical protein HKM93_11690 [Desulfobacteraceae bacterium]|nr:hypothetical protein [Desulfobacteraceae bacterium]
MEHRVGAKAARLSRMLAAGFPVPAGFTVTSHAFDVYLRHNRLDRNLMAINAPGSVDAIRNGSFPADLHKAVSEAIKDLSASQLAVRSSGVGEDGDDHSMAGQFDSFLQVAPEAVFEKIKECWAGLFGSAPTAYRRKMGADGDLRMGVIVQQLVDASMAGVVFTMDPLTKSADHYVVEWVAGLGDRLVSGQVEPERIYLRRENPEIPHSFPDHIAQTLGLVHQWAGRAEALFGHLVDMEWAAGDAGFFVVQSRPITRLSGENTAVWTNVNMAENFPYPLTPMAWSLVDRFYAAYIRSILGIFGWSKVILDRTAHVVDNLTGLVSGRIYYNLDNWYAVMHFFPHSRWLIRFLNHYIGQKIPYRYQSTPGDRPKAGRFRLMWNRMAFWPRLTAVFLYTGARLKAFELSFLRERRQWRRVPYRRQPAAKLASTLSRMLSFVERRWAPPAMADILTMILPGVVDMLIEKWLKENPETISVKLFGGLDLISIQPSVKIWEVAREIKKNPGLSRLLVRGEYEALTAAMDDELVRRVRDFMDRFGERCYHDCMIIAPTFTEKPALFWDLVKRFMETNAPHPLKNVEVNAQGRENFTTALLDRLVPVKRIIFRLILARSQQALALRERGRLLQSFLFGEMRAVVLELGRRLSTSGLLPDPADIFYLHFSEIEQLLWHKYSCPESVPSLVTQRRHSMAAYGQNTPPQFLFMNRGEIARSRQGDNHAPQDTSMMTGTGVSPGVVKARARVILDPMDGNSLQAGDILVTYATDPGWTPLFSIAGGLVLERGGLLSHGAIVAREFGIPAVAGVTDATQLIRDGDMISIDGHKGAVTVEEKT